MLSTMDSTFSSESAVANSRPSFPTRAGAWFHQHFRVLPVTELPNEAKNHAERENRPYDVVHAHLYHGIVDMVISLLGLAVVINSM